MKEFLNEKEKWEEIKEIVGIIYGTIIVITFILAFLYGIK